MFVSTLLHDYLKTKSFISYLLKQQINVDLLVPSERSMQVYNIHFENTISYCPFAAFLRDLSLAMFTTHETFQLYPIYRLHALFWCSSTSINLALNQRWDTIFLAIGLCKAQWGMYIRVVSSRSVQQPGHVQSRMELTIKTLSASLYFTCPVSNVYIDQSVNKSQCPLKSTEFRFFQR